MSSKRLVARQHEQHVSALCQLSDVPATVTTQSLLELISTAPDPETAARQVLGSVPVASETLRRKWRQTIMNLWAVHHPRVPLLPHLHFSSDEVATTPFLSDANAYLAAIADRPARLTQEDHEQVVATEDVQRLVAAVPSVATEALWAIENEWGYLRLRRLRATLQAVRLLRVVKDELIMVRSRYERWQLLPSPQQFYLLWHTDTYHTNWHDFAGRSGEYMQIVQDNLPLVWELRHDNHLNLPLRRDQWCTSVAEAFLPLWQHAHLLPTTSRWRGMINVLRSHALLAALEQVVLRGLLERHGLIQWEEEAGSHFIWTSVGLTMAEAERTQDLPCGLELLRG